MNLTKNDYINLLEFYNVKYKKNNSYKNLKKLGEKILANKLCKCIKSVDKRNENKSIAICRSKIFKNRNITFRKFTCKRNKKIIGLNKTIKNFKLYKN